MILLVSLNSKMALEGWNDILSCKGDIKIDQVCGNGHHTRHGFVYTTAPKSLKANHQSITRNIFETTINQLMTPMPSPTLSNSRFRVSVWTIRCMSYIQQDFPWAPLMTVPGNLLLCLASPYDTLPTPLNLNEHVDPMQ